MSELSERSKRAEDDYFRRKDQELIDRAQESHRARADADTGVEAERRALADLLGTNDLSVLVPLFSAGLRATNAHLLDWLPAIELAWVDTVDTHEREELRRQFATDPQTTETGAVLFREWLFVAPPREAFDAARRALRYRLDRLDPETRRDQLRRILERCEAVGRASGGVFGLGSISGSERRHIEIIRETLGDTPETHVGLPVPPAR